jgi:hypothetical protein
MTFDATAVRVLSAGNSVPIMDLSYRIGRKMHAPVMGVTGPTEYRGKDVSFMIKVGGQLDSPITVELPTVLIDSQAIQMPAVSFSRERHTSVVVIFGNC